jgi:DNA-binding response OmpR family regulator
VAENGLIGRSILVVEDEYMLAVDLKQELLDAGAIVVGPAASLSKAIDLIKTTDRLDAAILDVNLRGEAVFPAADMLVERGVPFILTTGYDRTLIPSRFTGAPTCGKPLAPDTISNTVRALVSKGEI